MVVITWGVINPDSVTHFGMKVCEVNSGECREHEIGDFTTTSQVNIPEGEDYEFSFYLYDGADLVATQERVLLHKSGISGVIVFWRCSISFSRFHINYM